MNALRAAIFEIPLGGSKGCKNYISYIYTFYF